MGRYITGRKKEAARKKRQQRTIMEAALVQLGNSLRQAAKVTGVSKTTVWKDLHYILPEVSSTLYKEVMDILRFRRSKKENTIDFK